MADISRADVAGLIQDGYSADLLDATQNSSAVLSAFTAVDMGTKTVNMPVLATSPHAKWVGETPGGDGVKPTAEATWTNKVLTAEEVAVIVPVHENVIDDATEDVLGQIARLGGQAIAAALDAAVLFGTNKPASWTSADLFAAATAAGNVFTVGTGADDLGGSILQAAGAVADAGNDPTDLFARSGLRFQLANLRSSDGAPIFLPSLSSGPNAVDSVQGLNAHWVKGTVLEGVAEVPVWDATAATSLVVDASKVRIGVRQDVTVKLLTEATVGGINLAENDMVALRFKARFGYVLAKDSAVGAVVPVATP